MDYKKRLKEFKALAYDCWNIDDLTYYRKNIKLLEQIIGKATGFDINKKAEALYRIAQDHFIVECDSDGEVPMGAFDNFR